jgi:L-ascorbate metabolism protein UlaG (beta-lactamase superfamily)
MVEPRRRRGRLRRFADLALAIAGVGVVVLFVTALVTTDRFRSLGGSPSDATRARMERSPQLVNGAWKNPEATELMKVGYWETTKHWFSGSEMREPVCPLPIVRDTHVTQPPASGLRVTWLGHSTTMIEIDGRVIVTDPNWSERSSPSTIIGPHRFHPPPIAIADLPKVDAVLISHEHFDHLDMRSVLALAERGAEFHVPLGIGAHLVTFGVEPAQVIEHDWWEAAKLGDVELVSTPARHFNGRAPWRSPGALWTSWSIVGPSHRVFFSGDTGRSAAFEEIGKREGPFDLAMFEIGQYHPDWGDIHLGPRGALDAFEQIGARYLLPIHWGTFSLAYHAWSEPAETIVDEAQKRGARGLVMPMLGQQFEPSNGPLLQTWWRDQPPTASRCPSPGSSGG